MTTTVKDTGERKQMFGYTARHLIFTMESESSPDACTPMKSKMQWDGWYIDAAFALDCQNERYAGYQPKADKNGCRDRYVSKQVGAGKRGYPLYEKMTMFDESGKETYTYVNEVIELSNATLDTALFDVPAGYREVKDSSELYASMANQRKSKDDDDDDNPSVVRPSSGKISSNMNSPVSSGNSAPSQNSAPVELGAKKEGMIRIGLANVKVGAVTEGMNPQALAQVIQNTFGDYIKTPQVELVPLEAKLQSAIDAEAKSKECDYVLYTNASYKKGGGGGMFGKMIGNVAGSAIGHVGYGSTGAAVAAGVAQTAIYTAASMAGNVKSKDEITLEIKLAAPESANAVLAKQFKVKAKSDGDDIITTVIEQTSQAVVDAAKK
jgi:hypothetical protein